MKKKSLVLVAMVACLSLASMFTSLAGEWKQVDKEWCYVNDDGSYTNSKWQQIDGQWYYFDSNSYMSTTWNWIEGKWYHIQDSGVMDANIAYETGNLGVDGAWVTTKAPVGFWAATDEDITYWNAMQVKYGIADIKHTANSDDSVNYTVTKDNILAVPDYENVFKSRALEDFSSFTSALNWNDTQMIFTVWPIDGY